MKLDIHGHWMVMLQTCDEERRGIGWLSVGDDTKVRNMLIAKHEVFVQVRWQHRQVIRLRGTIYQGTATWSSYCPPHDSVSTAMHRRYTEIEEAGKEDRGVARVRDPVSSVMDEIFASDDRRREIEEGRLSEVSQSQDSKTPTEERYVRRSTASLIREDARDLHGVEMEPTGHPQSASPEI